MGDTRRGNRKVAGTCETRRWRTPSWRHAQIIFREIRQKPDREERSSRGRWAFDRAECYGTTSRQFRHRGSSRRSSLSRSVIVSVAHLLVLEQFSSLFRAQISQLKVSGIDDEFFFSFCVNKIAHSRGDENWKFMLIVMLLDFPFFFLQWTIVAVTFKDFCILSALIETVI